MEAIDLSSFKQSDQAHITIEVSRTLVARSGEWVEVTWRNVSAPSSSDDWVAMFSPPGAFAAGSTPIKFFYAGQGDPGNTGAGRLRVRMLNMRAAAEFVFFRGGLRSPTLAARSLPVRFADPNEPLQGRLALTARADEMRVSWTTRDAGRPAVWFGRTPADLSSTVTADSSSYERADLCGEPATGRGWRAPGTFHTAVLQHLAPDTPYFYRFGDAAGSSSSSRSAVHSFRTAPRRGSPRPFDAFVFGDMGATDLDGSTPVRPGADTFPTAANVTAGMLADADADARFVLHFGDISYARGYAADWEVFHAQVEPLATRLPWMTGIGNHERDWSAAGPRVAKAWFNGTDSGGECGVPYERRFLMPRPAPDQPWYAFDWGAAHFVVFSTEHNFTRGSAQHRWLRQDLAAVDRTATPWVVVAGHRPMYIDSTNEAPGDGDLTVAALLRRELEPLLRQHGVQLALWGHHHSYQRTCRLYAGECVEGGEEEGTVHLVVGTAGAGNSRNVQPDKPSIFTVVSDDTHGAVRLRVDDTSITGFYRTTDGRVADTFTLHLRE